MLSENGITTEYVTYNGLALTGYNTSGEQTEHYCYGTSLLVAELATSVNENKTGTNLYYYIKNSHGDVIGLSDNDGTLTETYTYDAFGTLTSIQALNKNGVLAETEIAVSRFMYAGEQYDSITELYYLRARRYDTTAGRFTQEDTYLGDGRNLYAYVGNNPLKYVDPSGHGKSDKSFTDAILSQMLNSSFGMTGDYYIQTGMVLGLVIPYTIQESEPIDVLQTGLDMVGLIPAYGEAADFVNGAIYAYRGDVFNAAISLTAAVPITGAFVTSAKLTTKAAKAGKVLKKISDALGSLDNLYDGKRILDAATEAIDTGTDAARYSDELFETVVEGGSDVVEKLDDILSNKTLTNQTKKVDNYVSSIKGDAAAKVDFDAMDPTNIRMYSNGTIAGDLPDGRTINIHPSTTLGGTPSVEIYDPVTGKSIKIRY